MNSRSRANRSAQNRSPLLLVPLLIVGATVALSAAIGQEPLSSELQNGGMEVLDSSELPTGWKFASQHGGQLTSDTASPAEGERAAQINASAPSPGSESLFSNLMQTIDGVPWRGKKIRFRAAVRTADLVDDAAAQLWFRVDRDVPDGTSKVGAFDNMARRPIRDDEWSHYDIVLEVDEDAKQIVLGMFLAGRGRAWIDDVSLAVADDGEPTTGGGSGDDGSSRSRRFSLPPILQRAFAEAEKAPQQPFFTPWLWLVAFAIALFVLSAVPAKEREIGSGDHVETRRVMGLIPKFALRFSVAYWLLYSLPEPFVSFMPLWGEKITLAHQALESKVVRWTAEHALGITGELIPPNGSGDTTSSYIAALIVFTLALGAAGLWTFVDRRPTDYRIVKDLLRSYLRYVLAFAMFGYGLAKVSWDANQFPEIRGEQLIKTWGDSSPMNVIWSMMGASRAYTVFAGAGELVGGFFLLWRRTATLGALVSLGVMANVMMLNYCYDIPVKLYSTHLVAMAGYLLLHDAPRLANVLFWNKPAAPAELRPPYVGRVSIWIKRALKAAVIIAGFGVPLYQHVDRQVRFGYALAQQPDFFGSYDVVQFRLDGREIGPETANINAWETVIFETLGYNMKFDIAPVYWIKIRVAREGDCNACFKIENDTTLVLDQHTNEAIPKQTIEVTPLEGGNLRLAGETRAGRIEADLRRQPTKNYRLTGRGFRWINEVPFNR